LIKRFIIAFILLVLVCGGIVGWNLFRDKMIQQYFATMKPPAATVSTVVVKPSSWTPGVEAIGTVRAVRGVDLTVETTGIVKDIAFHANQKVAANDVLLQLDDAVERADLQAQKAQAASDQAALTRAVELQRRGVGTDATLDAARAAATASASLPCRRRNWLPASTCGATCGVPIRSGWRTGAASCTPNSCTPTWRPGRPGSIIPSPCPRAAAPCACGWRWKRASRWRPPPTWACRTCA